MTRIALATPRSLELTTAAAAFGLGSLLGLTSGCSTPASAAPPERAVTSVHADTIVAEARAVPRTISLTGTLLAAREAEVAAEASGKVVSLAVDRGDRVESGASLARLDARALVLVRAEASASAAGLVAQQESAELDCARAERLYAANVISRAEYDRTTASCTSSGHSVDAAMARAGLAQKSLSDAVVRAPFAGLVAERRVEVGDYVNAGRTLLTVVDISTLKLEVAVPETQVASIAPGRSVAFEVAAYPEREFSGVVRRVAPSLRKSSRDQLVEVSVDNREGALRPGMFAEARVAVGEARFPVVPLTAIRGKAPVEHLFVVRPDLVVEERAVATGDRAGSGVAVVRGISAGERIVASPGAAVRDGVKVQ
jgi:membrane fusion protein (multidrug efflux system)